MPPGPHTASCTWNLGSPPPKWLQFQCPELGHQSLLPQFSHCPPGDLSSQLLPVSPSPQSPLPPFPPLGPSGPQDPRTLKLLRSTTRWMILKADKSSKSWGKKKNLAIHIDSDGLHSFILWPISHPTYLITFKNNSHFVVSFWRRLSEVGTKCTEESYQS